MKMVIHSQDRAVNLFVAAVLTGCLFFLAAVQTPELLVLAKNIILGLAVVVTSLIVSIDPGWWGRCH